jgi:hypothetical protein
MTREEQWFIEGFVKRAQDYGIQPEVAENLLPKKKIVLPGIRSANVTKKTPSALNKFDPSSLKKLPEKQPEKPVNAPAPVSAVRDTTEEQQQPLQAQHEYEEAERERRRRDMYLIYEHMKPVINWPSGYPHVFPKIYQFP